MTAIVFAGPSLHGHAGNWPSGVELRPPVAQGDVYRAVRDKPRAIGIIDGYFEGFPSVWHKEILHALESGIAVWGAASMGALRAAELDRFGMIGVGRIYAWYRDGVVDEDAEVAVLHGPAETAYMPLSEPLVNVRATLAALRAEAKISAAEAGQLLEAARGIHYADRTLARLVDRAALPHLAKVLADGWINLKQHDALELIGALSQSTVRRPAPEWTLERTLLWERAVASWDAVAENPLTAVLDEFRLADPEAFAAMRQTALQRHLLLNQARSRGLAADRQAKLQALDRLRGRLGLDRRAQLDEWLAANQLDMPMLDLLMSDEARVEQAAAAQEAADIDEQMLRLLKLSGRYAGLAARAASKAGSRSATDASAASPPPPVLLSWYGKRHNGATLDDLDRLVADLGLASRQEFYRLLANEYLYLQATAPQPPGST